MITVRPANERGHANHGWLDTWHTFSFDTYFDPRHMGFRSLRVINDDVVQPGRGFGTHGHRDMEIVTYVLEGALAHKDSSGGAGTLRYGDVQHMTAGYGVRHSEFNPSHLEPVHLLQIWILPEREGLTPGYDQKSFAETEKLNRLRLIASREANDGSLPIRQDASIYASVLEQGHNVRHELALGRHGWLQVASGEISVNGTTLETGDGAAISDENVVEIAGNAARSEFLLFDLA